MLTITFIRRDFVHGTYQLHTVNTSSTSTAWAIYALLTGVIRPRIWKGSQLLATRRMQ